MVDVALPPPLVTYLTGMAVDKYTHSISYALKQTNTSLPHNSIACGNLYSNPTLDCRETVNASCESNFKVQARQLQSSYPIRDDDE